MTTYLCRACGIQSTVRPTMNASGNYQCRLCGGISDEQSPPPTPATATPRTDAIHDRFNATLHMPVLDAYCEMADFARTLERENEGLRKERDEAMATVSAVGITLQDLRASLLGLRRTQPGHVCDWRAVCDSLFDKIAGHEKGRGPLIEWFSNRTGKQQAELETLRADVARLKADGERLDKYAKLVESEHEDTPVFEDGKWTTHHLLAPPPDCAAGVGTRRHKDLRSAIDAARKEGK